jgi:hypothetical protein
MATAIYARILNNGVLTMEPKQLRPELTELVQDLLALKAMGRDGIFTHHSQRELVKNLNARDLADVARAVSLAEKRQQPIYTRNTEVKQQ